MPVWLLGLWANPWVRKITLVLAIVLGVWLAYKWAYRSGKAVGKEEGLQEGKASQVELDKRQFTEMREDYLNKMSELTDQIKTSNARVLAADARLGDATRTIQALAASRQLAQDKVQTLSDPEVVLDLAQKLQLRDLTDKTPQLYPRELRKADLIVTDYQNLQAQGQALTDKVDAVTEKVNALSQKLDAVEQQRDLAVQWGNQVEGYYVKAYNAVPKKGNTFLRIITFGIKGRAPKLDFPDPVDLRKLKPAV